MLDSYNKKFMIIRLLGQNSTKCTIAGKCPLVILEMQKVIDSSGLLNYFRVNYENTVIFFLDQSQKPRC